MNERIQQTDSQIQKIDQGFRNREKDFNINDIFEVNKIFEKVLDAEVKDRNLLISRVFEHSVADGIKLAEKVSYTDRNYIELISSFSFYLKHNDLAHKLIREAKVNIKNETDRQKLFKLEGLYKKYDEQLDSESNNGASKLLNNELEDRKKASFISKELLANIDDYYSQFLRKRKFEEIDERFLSKGERLALDILEDLEFLLSFKKENGYIPDFYKPTDILFLEKIKLASSNLLKEINDSGSQIIFDAEKKEYKLDRLEQKEKKYLSEEKILDKLDDFIKEGVNKYYIALGLAGLDSDRAWQMREDFIKEGVGKNDIARGLAGLDSDRAWQMREDFIKEGVGKNDIARGLAGLDSDRSWKMRDDLIKAGVDKAYIAGGLAGDYITFVWQKANKGKSILNFELEKKLKLINILNTYFSFEVKDREGLGKKEDSEQKEKKYLSEEKILDKLNDFIKEGVDKSFIAKSLAGLDSDRAWQMREDLIKQETNKMYIAQGLAGLDSERAWKMREELKEKIHDDHIFISLIGLDSDRAWEMRDKLIKEGANKNSIALGLTGLDSDRAWQMREDLIKAGVNKDYIALGLAGLDSDRAWKMRDKLIKEGAEKEHVAKGLAGLDSDRAWQMREDFIKEGVGKHDIARGLAGLDSDRAWKMRDKLIKEGAEKEHVAKGLAGLDSDRAWQMREDLIKAGVDKACIALGLAGDYITFVWQKANKNNDQISNKDQYITNYKGAKFDEDKLLEDISLYLNENIRKKRALNNFATSSSVIKFINSIIKKKPELFIETINAKKGNKRITSSLTHKVFPSTVIDNNKSWRGFNLYSGFNAETTEAKPRPEDYLNPNNFNEMLGGDPRDGSNESKEVIRLREPINEMLVSGIYGKMSGNSWDASYQFPLAKENIIKSKETTITLPHIGRQVRLPKTLGSNVISERVKGIRANNEIALDVSISPMQEVSVEDTKNSNELVYSLQIDQVPREMRDISENDYEKYQEKFIRLNGNEMKEEIVDIPEEIDIFLDKIKNIKPKERVLMIEEFIRSICYYDMNNGEMMAIKRGKSVEERLEIMEARVEELRSSGSKDDLSNKKYAGVCADFAVLTTAILRRAGFASGVLSGFNTEGTTAYIANAHATSFIVWPNRNGDNSLFSVDGTPSGISGISSFSLREKEATRKELIKELKNDAEKDLEEMIKILDGYNEKSIEGLTNGKLETVLNNILQFGVNQNNLKTVENILNAYWYTPISGLDLNKIEDKESFLKFFEDEITRIDNNKQNENEFDAGTKLFETVEDFIQKFAKSKNHDLKKSFETITSVKELVSPLLSKNEKNAFGAIITYLKAKKIK